MDVGQTKTFTATPSGGSGTLSYQWYVDSNPVGSNSATYSYAAALGSHSVTCTVTDSASVAVTSPASNAVTISVAASPTVSIAPVGPIKIDVGQSQTFTATPVGGSGTIHYQWYLGGSTPVGSDSNAYLFSGAIGSYLVTCKVTDSASVPVTSSASNAVSIKVTTTTTLSPSVTAGSWTTPTNAYSNGLGAATDSTSGHTQRYSGYGFNIPSSAIVIQVRVRLDAWCAGNDQLKLQVSNNGGTSYLSSTSTPVLTTVEATYWVDVTGWTAWTPAMLNSNQIWTQITQVKNGGADMVILDWIPIEVTYTLP